MTFAALAVGGESRLLPSLRVLNTAWRADPNRLCAMGKRARRRSRHGGSEPSEVSPRLAHDPPTRFHQFKFGSFLPPDDVVGHFVVGLAAIANDLNLVNSLLFPPDDPDRDDFDLTERMILMRLLFGRLWEARLYVEDARRNGDVGRFLNRMASKYPQGMAYTGEELVAFLTGDVRDLDMRMRSVLRTARNATFHYPKVGSPELSAALRSLTDVDGEVAFGRTMIGVRFGFAERVMLSVAGPQLDDTSLPDLFESITPLVIAVIHLAQLAHGLRAIDTDTWNESRTPLESP